MYLNLDPLMSELYFIKFSFLVFNSFVIALFFFSSLTFTFVRGIRYIEY